MKCRKRAFILPDHRKANEYDRLHPLIAMKLEQLEKRREMVFVAETDKGEKIVGRFRN